MAKIVLEEQPEFLVFPADSILELKIEESNIETVNGRNGEWQKVALKFKILGIQALGDGASPTSFDEMITQTIYGSVPFKLTDSPENRLRMWAEAIFNTPLGLGFELDTDLFVSRRVRGLTSQYDSRATDPVTGLKFKRHQVESLLPMGANGVAPQQAFNPAQLARPTQQQQGYAFGQQQQQAQPQMAGADPWGAPGAPDPWGAPAPGAPQSAGWDEEPPF